MPTGFDEERSGMPRRDAEQVGTSLTAWARSAAFPEPIRLGEVEAEVLSRPVRVDVPRPARSHAARLAFLIAVSIFLVSPGVLGVVALLLADRAVAASDVGAWLTGSTTGYLLAIAFPVAVMTMWFTVFDRHRTGCEFPTGAASAATGVAGLIVAGTADLTVPGHLTVCIVLSIVAGAACVALAAFASRPGPPSDGLPEHVLAANEKERMQFRSRTLVLHVLRDRGLVDHATWARALEMPLGTWHELDR